jgi:hypothetical protein
VVTIIIILKNCLALRDAHRLGCEFRAPRCKECALQYKCTVPFHFFLPSFLPPSRLSFFGNLIKFDLNQEVYKIQFELQLAFKFSENFM